MIIRPQVRRTLTLPVILITLRRTPERTAKAHERLRKFGFTEYHTLWASDGSDPEQCATMPRDPACHVPSSRWIDTRFKPIMGLDMSPGECGCCMSWWRACAMIVKNGWQHALVLEDDAEPVRGRDGMLRAIQELPSNFGVALMHCQQTPEPKILKDGHTTSFYRVAHSSWTTVAMLVSNLGARALLRSLPPFEMPVDVHIGQNLMGVPLYQPKPGGGWFRQDNWDPSTVRYNSGAGTIPKVIHRIWVGGKPIPEEYERYWETWKAHHPDFEFKTWGDADLDAAFPGDTAIAVARSGPVQQRHAITSDIARLLILRKFGGLYVDTDFECLRSFEPILNSASAVIALLEHGTACNGIMASVPGHNIILRMAKEGSANVIDGVGSILDQAGPRLVQKYLSEFLNLYPKPLMHGDVKIATAQGDSGVTVVEPWVCFPYYWHQEKPASYGKAWAVHHWARSWWGEKEWSEHEAAKVVLNLNAA